MTVIIDFSFPLSCYLKQFDCELITFNHPEEIRYLRKVTFFFRINSSGLAKI